MYAWFRRTAIMTFALLVFGVGGLGWYAYIHYTDPVTIRRLFLTRLRQHLPGAQVELRAVEGHPLGGLYFRDLVISTPVGEGVFQEMIRFPTVYIVVDKDKLMQGQLEIRRAAFEKPTLRLRKLEDGKWNFTPYLRKEPFKPPFVCAIDIKDGKIHVISDDPAIPGMDWSEIAGTVKMAPPPGEIIWNLIARLPGSPKIHSTGATDLVKGKFHIEAATDGPVDIADLRARCPSLCSCMPAQNLDVTGKVALKAQLDKPDAASELKAELKAIVQQATVRHPTLPYPVTEADAEVIASLDGIVIPKLRCRCGPMLAEANGNFADCLAQTATIKFAIANVPFSPELYRLLPAKPQEIWKAYSPEGQVNVRGEIKRVQGKWSAAGIVSADDIAVTYEKFPYRADKIKGEMKLHPDGHVSVEGKGQARGRPVAIGGVLGGVYPLCRVDIQLSGTGVPFDEHLIEVIPEKARDFCRKFKGTGQGDFVCHLTRADGETKVKSEIEVDLDFADCTAEWFPYRLEEVKGRLSISPLKTVFRRFTGCAGKATARIDGQVINTTDGAHIEVHVHAQSVPIDGTLKRALPESWDAAWAAIQPSGKLDVWCTVVKGPESPCDVRVSIDPKFAAIEPPAFPYRFEDFEGRIEYADRKVSWQKMQARHGDVVWRCAAGEVMAALGGGHLTVHEMVCPRLPFDKSLRDALPPVLQATMDFLQPDRPVFVRFKNFERRWYTDANRPAQIDYAGDVEMVDADIVPSVGLKKVTGRVNLVGTCEGERSQLEGNLDMGSLTVAGFTATQLLGRIEMNDGSIAIKNIKGGFYGGEIHGLIRATCPPTPAYDCRLDVFDASLAKYAQTFPNAPQIDAAVNGQLYLKGAGPTINKLSGSGAIQMNDADIYRLPFLFDLLDFLSLQMPDGQAFESANTAFRLQDKLMIVDELEIKSPTVSLFITERQGRLNLDNLGIDLRLGVRWAKGKLNVPIFSQTLNTASDQLFTVLVDGKLTEPTFTPGPGSMLRQILDAPNRLFNANERQRRPAPR